MFCSRCGTEVDANSKFCPSCGLDLTTATPVAQSGEPSELAEIEVVRDALKDEYEVLRELGRGGMAIVFQAREKHLERDVALKVLPFSLSFDKEFVERFQREARTAARLEHPNIISIYRVGKSGRVIYFVMKFLRGTSLSDILERRGRMPPHEIKKLLVQTAGALGYAHKHGIVHRDIKPDNIMFDEMGNAIVTDFGIAKAATGTRLTGTGMAIGTPHYMSPEQARAQTLDGRSDLYSLGVLAYQCLAGHVPFDAEDAFSIGYKHIMEPVPPPELHTAEERRMFEIVRRMMAKSADDRFQNADELLAALEGGAPIATTARPVTESVSDLPTTILHAPDMSALGLTAAPRAGSERSATPTTPMPKSGQPRVGPESGRKRSGVLVGLLLFFVIGGGGAGAFWYFGMDAQWPPRWPPAQDGAPSAVGSQLDPATPGTDLAMADSLTRLDGDSVEVELGGTGEAAAPRETGTILVRDMPSLARLTINGQVHAGDSIEVSPGSMRIEVTKTSFEPFDTSVVVGRGETVAISVGELHRAAGAAPVTAQSRPQVPPSNPSAPVRAPEPQPRPNVCVEPGAPYNSDGSCFDDPPTPARACVLDRPDGATQRVTGTVWVKIAADGTMETQQQVQADNLRFRLTVRRFLQEVSFQPARKGGRPVPAWLLLSCVSR
ncbi:MAG TPA: protein kinase [Gemmatimonadales bacterium]|jgi:serine/threonine-protein kinase